MGEKNLSAVLHFRGGLTLHCDLRELPGEDSESVHAVTQDGERKVSLSELKAIFFLRHEGQPLPEEGSEPQTTALTVTFVDAEVIRGSAGYYNPEKNGFYLFPADRSKNERIFVVSSAIASIEAEKI